MSVTGVKVPVGKEQELLDAHREAKTLKGKITGLINDGADFATLAEVNRLASVPDITGIHQELACNMARAKSVDLTNLLTLLESAAAQLVALVMSLGEDLNSEDNLAAVVKDVTTSCDAYAEKTRAALSALAAAAGGARVTAATGATAPGAASPRQKVTNFVKSRP